MINAGSEAKVVPASDPTIGDRTRVDSGPAFVPATENIIMAKEKQDKGKAAAAKAHDEAEKDMSQDPEFSAGDPTDDLDEGELARRDNSDEDALDSLERRRGAAGGAGHAGRGKEA